MDFRRLSNTASNYESVRLTESAYETLKRRKHDDETLSETIERLAKGRPIRDLDGLVTDEEVEAIRTEREKRYENYTQRCRSDE